MSFKLKAKILFLQTIEKLPTVHGDAIYHLIQKVFSSSRLSDKIKASHNSYRTLEGITRKLEVSLSNKIVLEIGSGWLPLMPYFFYYFGNAKKVVTYDLNEHYNYQAIKKLNKLFSEKYKIEIGSKSDGKYPLPGAIKYFPKTNLTEQNVSANFVFSRFVLEHVHPEDIKEMHEKFKSELDPGSYIIHFISPGDHRAYLDKSLSLQDFLKYSQSEWDTIQTRFDYHNRWRLPQYIELFNELDLEIVFLDYGTFKLNSLEYQKFKNLKIHSDFEKYNNDDLTAGAINIVLKT